MLFDLLLRKISFRLFPFLFLLYLFSYLDRINISFAGAPMCKELGYDPQTFGFGGGIFFISYFLFGIPSNLALEKVGARKWISIIMVIWGIISVLMAFVAGTQLFFVLRFLLGAAEAGFFPGIILYLTYWFPKAQRGLAVAKFMTAVPAAGFSGAIIANQVFSRTEGLLGLAAWKWLFVITGFPSILLGLAALFVLCDKPQDATWLSADEKQLLATNLGNESSTAGGASLSKLNALKSAPVWLFALLYFCITLPMYGFTLWLPQIISNSTHADNARNALLTAIPYTFQAIGMVLIAGSSDKHGERHYHFAFATGIAAIGLFLCAAFLQNGVLAMAALCIAAFGIWGSVGPFWAIPTNYLAPSTSAGGIALINSVGNLGGFAGPYIVGAIKEHSASFSTSLIFLACPLIIAAILICCIKMHSATKPSI
jgi:MFS transporter, ACS family, tartrate transporter